ncbi:MAG: hypothetical protein RBJ76_03890 [Stenomitos frigidus ULC029]
MRNPSAQATLAAPYPRDRVTSVATVRSLATMRSLAATRSVPSVRQPARSRESATLILLVQAGWVGVALVIIACLPAWKADFDQRVQSTTGTTATPVKQKPAKTVSPILSVLSAKQQELFTGGSDSLVARTVGHAEGTRTPDGRKTRAYYGHTDPGNGVWNLGSFSFQHCREVRYSCSTPEQADEHQLQRLQSQHAALQQRATAAKLLLTLPEILNGIDLANQAPLAALSDQGYIDRLVQAKQKGFNGQEAILEARVWSYWHPQKNRWDAAGLGNTEANIRHDQRRRLLAIARAMTIAQQQRVGLSTGQHSLNLLKLQPETANPYSFSHQRSDYLWWDAGYWDAKLNQQQLSPGTEPAYDQGFANAQP